MKRLFVLGMTAMMAASMAFAVHAEETETAEVVAHRDTVWETNIYGEWTGVSSVGDDSLNLVNEYFDILDSDSVVIGGETVPITQDGDVYTLDLSGIDMGGNDYSMQFKYAPATEEVINAAAASYSMTDTMIEFTVAATDNSNPLKPAELSCTTYFLKDSYYIYDTFETMIEGKTLTADGIEIALNAEDESINLNNGQATGSYFIYNKDDIYAYIRFSWETGGSAEYMVTAIDENGVSLENIEDASDVYTFTYGEAASAPAAEVETEAATEAATE